MQTLSSKLRSAKTRSENLAMKSYLLRNGINVQVVKHVKTGSLKGTIYLYAAGQEWSQELCNKMTTLNFTDYDGSPLTILSGNGKRFSLHVKFSKFEKCCY